MNDGQEYYKVMQSLEMHAVGVGAEQATEDGITKYPELAPYNNQLQEYLTNVVRNNELTMEIHQGVLY